MTSFYDAIRKSPCLQAIIGGDHRKEYLVRALNDGTPTSLFKQALMQGVAQRIEGYRQLIGSEMDFGDPEKYPRLINEGEQVLAALHQGKKFTYNDVEIPGE